MKVEKGVCPNCSEVVLRLTEKGLPEALEALAEAGITVKTSRRGDLYGETTVAPDETENVIVDAENPLLPDRVWFSSLTLEEDFDDCGSPAIVGFQHCQCQLFPTMLKIEEALGKRFVGYDGGSVDEYLEWKEDIKDVKAFVADLERRAEEELQRRERPCGRA